MVGIYLRDWLLRVITAGLPDQQPDFDVRFVRYVYVPTATRQVSDDTPSRTTAGAASSGDLWPLLFALITLVVMLGGAAVHSRWLAKEREQALSHLETVRRSAADACALLADIIQAYAEDAYLASSSQQQPTTEADALLSDINEAYAVDLWRLCSARNIAWYAEDARLDKERIKELTEYARQRRGGKNYNRPYDHLTKNYGFHYQAVIRTAYEGEEMWNWTIDRLQDGYMPTQTPESAQAVFAEPPHTSRPTVNLPRPRVAAKTPRDIDCHVECRDSDSEQGLQAHACDS